MKSVTYTPGKKASLNQPCVSVLGVPISKLTLEQLLDRIDDAAKSKGKAIFGYADIHAINTAFKLPWLRNFYNTCDGVFCDGVGVKLAARLLGQSLPERFTFPDWIDRLAAQCIATNQSLFFIGGSDGVAQKAAQKLVKDHPGLQIVGTNHGYFDKTRGAEENNQVVQLVNRASPDVLIVGFGIPIQEKWLMENVQQLHGSVFLAAGALFDYLAGVVPRGPRWMTDHGLEWLSRLLIEPRRLWSRYLIGIPLFFIRVFRQRLGMLKA
jgi:N-acetylglucosaminyldiphosphoundecaprenol N-acetyl-beta-D-mannosaminyltransferase